MIFSAIACVGLRFNSGLLLLNGRPTILQTIMKDSTVYFLVIFSSHLLSLVMVLVTRVSSTVLAVIGIMGDR